MNLQEALDSLPTSKGVVVILSGGMDSTIALRLAVQKYWRDHTVPFMPVHAITFDYGQKQRREITMAKRTCAKLGVTSHKVIKLNFLNLLSQGVSANVDRTMTMPTIQQVLGDPAPKTEVPFRNMIMLSIASCYAQSKGLEHIICGLQVHDEYGYWDTTGKFLEKMNAVLDENRKDKIKIIAPFAKLNKYEEIMILDEMEDLQMLENTLTCYNPDSKGSSCGTCPSCSERIMNFAKAGFTDSVPYQIVIPWGKLIREHYVK
jgi:7-cyano-7-deazaguanine synthase